MPFNLTNVQSEQSDSDVFPFSTIYEMSACVCVCVCVRVCGYTSERETQRKGRQEDGNNLKGSSDLHGRNLKSETLKVAGVLCVSVQSSCFYAFPICA